jgi:hypothetical protein
MAMTNLTEDHRRDAPSDSSYTVFDLPDFWEQDTMSCHSQPQNHSGNDFDLTPSISIFNSHQDQVRAFSLAVIQGHWENAEDLLCRIFSISSCTTRNRKKYSEIYDITDLETSEDVKISALFALRRQIFLELLEEKKLSQALVLT